MCGRNQKAKNQNPLPHSTQDPQNRNPAVTHPAASLPIRSRPTQSPKNLMTAVTTPTQTPDSPNPAVTTPTQTPVNPAITHPIPIPAVKWSALSVVVAGSVMGLDVPIAVACSDQANRSSSAILLKTHTHWQGLLPQGGNAHNLLTTADDTDAQRCQISCMAADGKAWRRLPKLHRLPAATSDS